MRPYTLVALAPALLLGACCATNPPRPATQNAAPAAPQPSVAPQSLAPESLVPPGAGTALTARETFQANCGLPFSSPGAEIDFDDECGNEGSPDPSDPDARAAEYTAKNNLCAQGTPVALQFGDFQKLQVDVDNNPKIQTGDMNISVPDRSVLKDLPLSGGRTVSEGQVVQVVGFASVKPRGSKEGVNCGQTKERTTDIHINVSPKSGNECAGIVIEIIPHRRPDHWSHTEAVNLVQNTVVRATGQLFLDSRHSVVPRTGTQCPDPKRVSLWEVHPVYALDICRRPTLAECKVDDDSVWKAF